MAERPGRSLFQRLYDSEINFEVSGFYDAGFTVKLGDASDGYDAETTVRTWFEVEMWLREYAMKLYPDSDFAKAERAAGQLDFDGL